MRLALVFELPDVSVTEFCGLASFDDGNSRLMKDGRRPGGRGSAGLACSVGADCGLSFPSAGEGTCKWPVTPVLMESDG
jgi:hypothetical protein